MSVMGNGNVWFGSRLCILNLFGLVGVISSVVVIVFFV